MMVMRFLLPDVENSVVNDVFCAISFSSFSAWRICAISN